MLTALHSAQNMKAKDLSNIQQGVGGHFQPLLSTISLKWDIKDSQDLGKPICLIDEKQDCKNRKESYQKGMH